MGYRVACSCMSLAGTFRMATRVEAGMVAHRGNLNYQDCRRTVTAGFEAGEVDGLREARGRSGTLLSMGDL